METGETACIMQTLSEVKSSPESAIKTMVLEIFQYFESGTPTMIRTWDPQIRNLVLYPTELPGRCERQEFYQSRAFPIS